MIGLRKAYTASLQALTGVRERMFAFDSHVSEEAQAKRSSCRTLDLSLCSWTGGTCRS